ncbi:MAG: tRNA (adenosine(37)-N6)-threonylcarbamoyltransferase complex dimerization subunit type 1 TsaB [Chloroflexi bacterium]|nr:tRNA (adenosine(37)-N6)-threonylcarbamoyltransferase complex dimerization subunit type 1 TsaB [Chloroflexota bacterium]
MELAIDTSTRYACVALGRDGSLLAELAWYSDQNHTVELLPAIERLLLQARVNKRDLTGIIVARGPGGFSALRVGMSTAKGLATVLSVPLIGVGTLEVEAFPYLPTGLRVYALLDAGRGEVAWAAFQGTPDDWQCVQEARISGLEELCEAVQGTAILCGEMVLKLADPLRQRLGPEAIIMAAPPPTRRPVALTRLGFQRLAGGADDPATLQPLYLRRPSITPPRSG